MKTIRWSKTIGVLCTAGLLAVLQPVLAQTATGSGVTTDPNEDVSNLSDLEVELKALEMATPLAASNAPSAGNFYSAQHAPGSAEEWPPLPANMFNLPIWPLDTNVFVIDDLNFNYGGDSAKVLKGSSGTVSETMVRADDEGPPTPPGGGGGGDTNLPPTPHIIPQDYGTNLWIAQWGMISNTLTAIASNSIADVEYEIQTNSDLTTTNWVGSGQFILGSEATNWTQFILPPPLATNNLFFRLQSWASSDGSGIPAWWESKYFGTNAVDPYADQTGDGYTLYQDFQNGWNPNVFRTPPAPQGLAANYNASTGAATITWLPSPGSVTGYILTTPSGPVSLSANATSYVDTDPNLAANLNSFYGYPSSTSFNLVATYTNGNSAAASVNLIPTAANVWLLQGAQGSNFLATTVSALPADTAAIRLIRYDYYAEAEFNDPSFNTTNDISLTSFTNGIYLMPPGLTAVPVDGYGYSEYQWYVRTINTNGGANSPINYLTSGYNAYAGGGTNVWLLPPYFDGRVQMKQNLIFQLRAASETTPFRFSEYESNNVYPYGSFTSPPTFVYWDTNFSGFTNEEVESDEAALFTSPSNYAVSSIFVSGGTFDWYTDPNGVQQPVFIADVLAPFDMNYRYRNFVFDTSHLSGNGILDTASADLGIFPYGGYYSFGIYPLELYDPVYEFNPSSINPSVSLLPANQTQWLFSEWESTTVLQTSGSDTSITSDGTSVDMAANAHNYFGLAYVSAENAYGSGSTPNIVTLNAGGNIPDNGGYIYPDVAQPTLQTVEYDFWNPTLGGTPAPGSDSVPGMGNFSPTNQSDQTLIVGMGNSIQVAGYAKMEVANSIYSDVYGYLGQYFTNAYEINTNGVVTTNQTGVLSPYGSFFPTQPGPVALVTMPDPDTGARGTGIVNCVSLNVDKNHDGTMDLSFNGPDATSQASPMVAWVNNGHIVPGEDGNLDQDIPVEGNYLPNYEYGQITCPRDLENFFRLWISGMPALTNGYQASLSWSQTSGNPAINLYVAYQSDSGYLTETNVAAAQISETYSIGFNVFNYGTNVATISPGTSYDLPLSDSGKPFSHFLFEGAGTGSGELMLTISDRNSNTVAQTGVWLDLHDVEDLYDRAIITNNMTGAVSNWSSSIETIQPATVQNPNEDTNIIVYVHGAANNVNDWLMRSDTVFRRLYWADYHGKLATVRWQSPTKFQILNSRLEWFNLSELDGYKSASALKNYLSQLNSQYPNYQLDLLPHSAGGSVVSEALREGAPFNNLILCDIAMSASCYNVNTPTNADLIAAETNISATPDWQPWGYKGVYTNVIANAGNIINYYNTNDSFLNLWTYDQIHFKAPDSIITYDGTNSYMLGVLITDSEESRAYVARSRTLTIGEQGPNAGQTTQGIIHSAVDLRATFGIGSSGDEHSAFYSRPIQTILPFYYQVLDSYNIPTSQLQ